MAGIIYGFALVGAFTVGYLWAALVHRVYRHGQRVKQPQPVNNLGTASIELHLDTTQFDQQLKLVTQSVEQLRLKRARRH